MYDKKSQRALVSSIAIVLPTLQSFEGTPKNAIT